MSIVEFNLTHFHTPLFSLPLHLSDLWPKQLNHRALPREAVIMAGDEVGRINVMDGEANDRMGVYTSCSNNVNKHTQDWFEKSVPLTTTSVQRFQATVVFPIIMPVPSHTDVF